MKWSDIKGVFHTHILKVKSVNTLPEGYLTVELDAEGLRWRPGEHAIFTLPGKTFSGRKWRAFSIAATPDEGVVRIGTRAGVSPSGFKRTLAALSPGETVKLNGPFGWYTLKDKNSPVILLAGGTGITAARAVLSQSLGTPRQKIHLVHIASGYHMFQNTLEKIEKKNVDMHFMHERDVTADIIDDLAAEYGNRAYYYVSGPPKMNRAHIKRLKAMGVKNRQIVLDPFLGY